MNILKKHYYKVPFNIAIDSDISYYDEHNYELSTSTTTKQRS